MATQIIQGVQYSGIWTMQQVNAAIAANTWPVVGPRLYSWGRNTNGNLGLGNTTNYSSPKQVGSLANWQTVASGEYFTTSIKTDGTLWSWGNNSLGQLGLGNTTYYSSPKQVGSLTTWYKIAAFNDFTLATKTDGTLWAWGNNYWGQLGLGDSGPATHRSSPIQVGSLTTWLNIASGGASTVATKTDGTLWTWGYNVQGQLGLGNTTSYSSPKQIGALTTWLNISCGSYQSFALKTDGTLWSWGSANRGALGLGNTTYYSSPKQIGALTNWLKIASAGYSVCGAIKTDGTLWIWGSNNAGQLGLGNMTNYSSPKQVGSLTNWSQASITATAKAIKTDGTLWTWGYNGEGQLGLNNTTGYSSPKQVGVLTTWTTIAPGLYFGTKAIAT